MKRYLMIAALVILVPLSGAAKCQHGCDRKLGDCNPRPSAPTPEKTHCVMTENGCISPPAKS